MLPKNSSSSSLRSLSDLGLQNPSAQFGGIQSSQSVGFPPQSGQNFGQQQQQPQQPSQGKILLCKIRIILLLFIRISTIPEPTAISK
jgi:hypothetical protein